MTSRDLFLAQLFTQRPRSADLIVVLCGEDTDVRCDTARELFKLRVAPQILLTGRRSEPPAIRSADDCAPRLLGDGVAPAALTLDMDSQNTKEQAAKVFAARPGSLILVASAYHLPRAYLTFIRPFLGDWWPRIVPVAANAPWHERPTGLDRTRAELWHVEQTKITQYQATGDCASYADGLEYLREEETRE